jgi:hypothetical protein
LRFKVIWIAGIDFVDQLIDIIQFSVSNSIKVINVFKIKYRTLIGPIATNQKIHSSYYERRAVRRVLLTVDST